MIDSHLLDLAYRTLENTYLLDFGPSKATVPSIRTQIILTVPLHIWTKPRGIVKKDCSLDPKPRKRRRTEPRGLGVLRRKGQTS